MALPRAITLAYASPEAAWTWRWGRLLGFIYFASCVPQLLLMMIVARRFALDPFGPPDGWGSWGPGWLEIGCINGFVGRWALAVLAAPFVAVATRRWSPLFAVWALHAVATLGEVWCEFWPHFQD